MAKQPIFNLTLRELGRKLGVKHQQLSRESKQATFPSKVVRGKRRFDLELVRAWRAANVKGHRSPAAPTAPVPADHPSIKALEAGDTGGTEIARAAACLAAQRVAQGAKAGTLSAHGLGDLKSALAELRAAEAAHLDIEERRRKLIKVEDVTAMMGAAVARLIRVFDTLETTIGTEFSLWLADPAIQAMGSDERARVVRDFVSKTGSELRTIEANDIEKMLAGVSED